MKALQTIEEERSVKDVGKQAGKITRLMKDVMIEGTHYGTVPGTNSPMLYKAGAEKLMVLFNLTAEVTDKREDLPDGHREYEAEAVIRHRISGEYLAKGVSVCSTMETRYRYRNNAAYHITDDPIPRDYSENKGLYRSRGFGAKKVSGEWVWVKYSATERAENPDIADVYNTVRKMAKKRALVDGVITATGASDIFTQDGDHGYSEEDDTPAVPRKERDATPQASVQEPASEDAVKQKYQQVIAAVNQLASNEARREVMAKTTLAYSRRNVAELQEIYNDIINQEKPVEVNLRGQ